MSKALILHNNNAKIRLPAGRWPLAASARRGHLTAVAHNTRKY